MRFLKIYSRKVNSAILELYGFDDVVSMTLSRFSSFFFTDFLANVN